MAVDQDLHDCQHGCNGDCMEVGSDVCTFVCHTDGPPGQREE